MDALAPWDTALTCGQAVAGMTAHAKGVWLGFYASPEERRREPAPPKPAGATGMCVRFRGNWSPHCNDRMWPG
jgi:hypothetical protein